MGNTNHPTIQNSLTNLSTGKRIPGKLFHFAFLVLVLGQLLIQSATLYAQIPGCDASVPTYIVNFTNNPDGSYTTPSVTRSGNCCGTSSPDRCIHFEFTIDSNTAAINFQITSGAIPPGALFYQIDCGAPSQVGEFICVTTPGLHHLTFCKPGNNANTYTITAIARPTFVDDTVRIGCSKQIEVLGLTDPTTIWNSIYPGTPGQYNSYLSCTTGCTKPILTAPIGAPPYIEYEVCGYPIADKCGYNFTVCDTLSVKIFPELEGTVIPNPATFCPGAPGIQLNASATGGLPPYVYTWKNPSNIGVGNTLSYFAATTGTYKFEVGDQIDGCLADVVTVPVSEATVIVATSKTDVLCNGALTGSATATPSGGTAPYTYSWSNGGTSQTISNLAAGVYDVTVTDVGGCTKTTSISLTQPTALGSSVASTTNVLCNGGPTGAIDISVSGGNGSYSYLWSNGATTQDLSNLLAGNYTITVTDANGCTSESIAAITQPGTLSSANTSSAVNGGYNISCFGATNGSIDLDVSGGALPYSYTWSNGATTQDISNLGAGSFNVTVTDANGCQVNSSATLTQPAVLDAPSTTSSYNGGYQISCNGATNGSIDVSVNGGTSPFAYSWSNGATTQDLTSLSAGSYNVTVTDANGCSAVTSNTLTQPNVLNAPSATSSFNGGYNISCNGATNGSIDLSVNGGTPPFTYNWSNGASTQDLSGLSAGSYNVTVTDANNCSAVTANTLTQPNILNAPSVTSSYNGGYSISCNGATNGSINLSVNGGTSPFTYNWSNGATTQDLGSLSAGSYSVTVTDANGCSAVTSNTLTQPNILQAPSTTSSYNGGYNISCNGATNGSIDLSVNGGTAPFVYNWSGGATTQDLSNLGAGTYDVTVTDANGCSAITSNTLTQPNTLQAPSTTSSFNGGYNISCNGATNGSIDLSVNGGTAPFTYNWSNGSTTQDISNLGAGSYSATVTDANGCSAVTSNTLTQPNTLQAPAVSSSYNGGYNISCNGATTGSINLSVNGGTSPFNYNWSSGATSQDISNLGAGTYNVTVTDANGCSAVTSNALTEPNILQAPSATSSFNGGYNISCNGSTNGSIDLSVNGGAAPFVYNWSNGATSQDIANLGAGTYNVTVTDANGCSAVTSNTLTQPNSLQSPAATSNYNGGYGISCNGATTGSVNLTVTGGTSPYNYNWSNGASTEDLSNLGAGTYNVTVTDANGCTSTASSNLTQPPTLGNSLISPTFAGGYNVTCVGNDGSINMSVSGGTAPFIYSWSNGASTEDLSSIGAGNFSVTVTDANGCTIAGNITLTQSGNLGAATTSVSYNGGYNISCQGSTDGNVDLTVTGGAIPYTYAWSNGATTQDLANLGAGTYDVTVTDANGCKVNAYATLTQPNTLQAPTVSSQFNGGYNISCNGATTGSIDLSVNGGTAPFTYAWSNGASSQDLSNLGAGNYTVTVTDANGCKVNSSVTLTQPNPLQGPAVSSSYNGGYNISCFGATTGSVNLSVNGGTPPFNYNWSNGATTQDISNLGAGTYSVTVTDANGCSVTTNRTLTQPNPLQAPTASSSYNGGYNISCFGATTGSIDLSVNGGATPYSYSWSNSASTQDLSGLGAGTYSVTVTDANGCSVNASATLTEPNALNAPSASSQYNGGYNISCFGATTGSVDLSVNGGATPYSYSWSNGASSQDILNLGAGTYSVTVTDANGCSTNASATLTQPNPLQAPTVSSSYNGGYNISCSGATTGSIDLSVNGGATPYIYNWSNGNSSQDLSNLGAGTYDVTVTDANGCSVSASATLTEPNPLQSPSASSQYNGGYNISCFGATTGSIDLSVNGGATPYNYNWSNGASSQDISNLGAGIYDVTVTDANGCTSTASATLTQPNPLDAPAVASSYQGGYNISCNGATTGSIDLNVSGGATPYTYNWSNGASSQDLSNLGAGTYSVTVTDANGCSDNASLTLTQPDPLNAPTASSGYNGGYNISCNGATTGSIDLSVSGGALPYSYSWSNGASSEDLSNLGAGTYGVTVTDANGCSASTSATLTQPNPLGNLLNSPQFAGGYNVTCAGNDGSINLSVNGGTPPFTYVWSNGASTQDLSGIGAGNFSVTITDANGCTIADNITLTQSGNLGAATTSVSYNGGYNISCEGNADGNIDLTVTGGATPYTYVWSNGATSQDLSNLGAGTYNVTVTDANGCNVNAYATLTQPGPLQAPTVSSQYNGGYNISCNGATTGSIDLSVNGGTAPFTYAWSNGSSSQDLANLGAGTFTVTVTDANGCKVNTSVTLTQPNPLQGPAVSSSYNGGYNISCFGATTGSINLNVNGGTPPFTYQWSNGSTSQDISNLSAGTYTVTVTDANGCSVTTTRILTEPNPLQAPTATSQYNGGYNISCFGATTGSIDLSVNGGATPYTYSWSNGSSSQDLSGLGAGTFNVTVTDANGCTADASATLTEPNPLQSPVASSQYNGGYNISCNGATTGSIDLDVNGGAVPYTYSWSNGSSSQDINNLGAGTYSVTITDANGCTTDASATLTEPNPLQSPVAATEYNGGYEITCFGATTGSVDLSVNGGAGPYNYSWSNGSSSQDISNLGAGTYNVTVTDANGCTAVASATLTEPNPLGNLLNSPEFAGGYEVTCAGNDGSVNLSVNGGTQPYSYQWSNGSTTQDLNQIGAGVYSVIITDANGCTISGSIELIQSGNLGVQASLSAYDGGYNISCSGFNNGSIDLSVTGGAGPYVYTWSNGSTSQDLNGLIAGSYNVTVTDANGCNIFLGATLNQPNPLTAPNATSQYNGGNNISCFGSTTGFINVSVNGGTAPFTYQWSNGATSQDLANLGAGSYSLIVTDANGCTAVSSATLTQPDSLQSPNASLPSFIPCFGQATGVIDLDVIGGAVPYTYQWSNGASTQDQSNLFAGSYSVTITDANGCVVDYTITITQPPLLTSAIASTINASCNGFSNGSIDLSINGGTQPYAYQWSNGMSTEDISNLTAGIYTVLVLDKFGCVVMDTVQITEPAILASIIDNTSNISCNGLSDGSISMTVSGGTLPYSYQWSNGMSSEDVSSLPAGAYAVTITDAQGCVITDSVTLTQADQLGNAIASPALNGNNQISCNGETDGSIDLTVSGGTLPYNYDWSNGANTEDLSGLGAGTYSVTVTDINGCSAQATITLTQPAPLVSVAGTDQDICGDATLLAGGVPPAGVTGTWSFVSGSGTFSDPNDPNALVTGLSSGNNIIIFTFTDGVCTHVDTVDIFSTDIISVNAGSDLLDICDSILTLSATFSGSGNGFWSVISSTGNPQFSNINDPNATVTGLGVGPNIFEFVVYDGACEGRDTVIIEINTPIECEDELEMPTAFSPNGDGFNDYFVIHGLLKYPDNNLTIFNRWGNVVYERDDYFNEWNGESMNGERLPDATYFAIFKVKNSDIVLTGYVDMRR